MLCPCLNVNAFQWLENINMVESRLRVSRYRWVVLLATFYTFVAFAFAFQEAPPLMDSIMQEFDISSHAEAGLLMSIVMIPGIFLGIPVGALVGRYGVKFTGFTSTVLIAGGCFLTSTANSFMMTLIGRLILGVGGVLVTTTMPAVISQWFSSKDLGKAMGIYGINMPLATVIAFPTASMLLLSHGWRYPFYISTIIGTTAMVVFTVMVKEGPLKHRENGQRLSIRDALRNVEIWKVGLVWLLFSASTLSFTTWAPNLFTNYKSMDEVYASFLASVVMLAAIPCVPVYGWVSDRIGRRKPLIMTGFILITLALIAAGYTSNLALTASIVTMGVAAAMVPPLASALLAEISGPSLAGVSFGVMVICQNTGATLGPLLIGYVIDVTQSLPLSFLGILMLSAAGAVVAYALKTR